MHEHLHKLWLWSASNLYINALPNKLPRVIHGLNQNNRVKTPDKQDTSEG